MKKVDLTGHRSGQLVVIREYGRKHGHVAWLCRCDCGNESVVSGDNLRSERIKSCGCLQRERAREFCTKHGLYTSHPRLVHSIHSHIKFIRCDTHPQHKNYKHLMIPAKYLGNSGYIRFVQEVISRYPEKADEYERNKNLDLDKDQSGVPVFAPWNIRFVTRPENLDHRRNTLMMNGTSLAKVCREEGIINYIEYPKIAQMWRKRGEIHPILWNARKQNLEKEERLLEMTKLKVRRAELMIKGLRELLALKQTA